MDDDWSEEHIRKIVPALFLRHTVSFPDIALPNRETSMPKEKRLS